MSKIMDIRKLYREFQEVQDNDSLASFVERHTAIVFGEDFIWSRSKISNADLEGKDSDKNTVIVEAKYWYVTPSNRSVQMHSAMGQIIQSASVHAANQNLKSMRLFIVGSRSVPHIEEICEFLRTLGLNVRYISVSDQLFGEIAQFAPN